MPKTALAKKPAPRKRDPESDKAIAGLVHAVSGSLVVADLGWAETIPDWVRKALPVARMGQIMLVRRGKAPSDQATDLEAMAFLYTASLLAPFTHDWTEIYLWLSKKCMAEWGRKGGEAIQAPASINQDQQEELAGLKRWLHRKNQAAINAIARAPYVVEPDYEQCRLWREKAHA